MRKPGSANKTRFMCIGLYELKIGMLQGQFAQSPAGRHQSAALCEYLSLIHAPYFLQARSAISAPRLDQKLWIDVQSYKRLYPVGSLQSDMADAAMLSITRHQWYLTQELVVFGLWDQSLPANQRKAMAKKLIRVAPADDFVWRPGKPAMPRNLPNRFQLCSRVGQRSWLIFHLLDASGDWLQQPVRSWNDDAEYKRMGEFLKDLSVVNDSAERCVKDITEYAVMARDSAHREDILLVVNDHRFVFPELRRDALANLRL